MGFKGKYSVLLPNEETNGIIIADYKKKGIDMGKRNRILLLSLTIFMVLITAGCQLSNGLKSVSADQETINRNIESPPPEVHEEIPKEVVIRITAVGDIMAHGPQLKAQYNGAKREYDFSNNFKYIQKYIEKSDLAICNLETTFAGEDKKYSSYPRFNSPDALAHALKGSGFDLLITANNHTIDMGASGVERTLSIIDKLGLSPLGTQKTEKEDNFIIKDIQNIKLGMIAYTYETPKYLGQRTLNALVIPPEVENQINTFSYDELDQDLNRMKNEIDTMRSRGAEVLIFYLHWGDENQRKPNKYQEKIAKALSDYGVDIILGSHPHVIQPIRTITSEISGKTSLVAYSLGNFLSNQRYEILNNRYTEDGIILNITILKDLVNNNITIQNIDYVPTWVNKYRKDGKNVYEIIPLNRDTMEVFNLSSEEQIWRANNSKKNTMEIIEGEALDDPVKIEIEKMDDIYQNRGSRSILTPSAK